MKCLLTSLILLIFLIPYGFAEISNISNSGTGNENSLILREVIFGNPDRNNILLSPDGTMISYLAPIKGVQPYRLRRLIISKMPNPSPTTPIVESGHMVGATRTIT